MQPLHYQPFSKSQRFARRVKRIARWLAVTVLTVVVGVVLYVGVLFYNRHKQIATFDERTSQARLIGKTPQQIISLLGPLYFDSRSDGGNYGDTDKKCVIGYEDTTGEICRIEITNGVATGVEHYMK